MQPVTVVLILTPLAYLLGTFPSAQLVARAGGHNVLTEGSGNPGASNVTRLMGWKAGFLVLVADFSKGAIAAGAGYAIDGRLGAYVLGVAAILGHVLPATRRFKGGKGVATAGGVLVVLFPWIVVGLAVVWVVIARVQEGLDRVDWLHDRISGSCRAERLRLAGDRRHLGAGRAGAHAPSCESEASPSGRGTRPRW